MAQPADKLLKIIARDSEDLQVFSALLQDAALSMADMAYDPKAKRFAFTANRYVWEKKRLFRQPRGWRRRVAVHFDHVSAVRKRDLAIEHSAEDAGFAGDQQPVFSLLSLQAEYSAGKSSISLIFAGDEATAPEITLEIDSIDAYLTDLSAAWEAIRRPMH